MVLTSGDGGQGSPTYSPGKGKDMEMVIPRKVCGRHRSESLEYLCAAKGLKRTSITATIIVHNAKVCIYYNYRPVEQMGERFTHWKKTQWLELKIRNGFRPHIRLNAMHQDFRLQTFHCIIVYVKLQSCFQGIFTDHIVILRGNFFRKCYSESW